MSVLAGKKCEACDRAAPVATAAEIEALKADIPDWEVIEEEGMKRLTRSFSFKNFVEALEFTNRVGAVAEEEAHHPRLVTEWGSVGVTWWTHKIKGLHINDFIMAAKTDALLV